MGAVLTSGGRLFHSGMFFFFFKGPPPINCPMRWNVVGEAVSVSGVSFGCPAGVGLT